ncbi:MAG: PLP-dependent aspartate aminotransferase family protein [Actinomycetota bacterium]|nr:aminotransferase class I/II-fold pyridoxal phosphate-dependent enzyme [Actinomycetota bacterium]
MNDDDLLGFTTRALNSSAPGEPVREMPLAEPIYQSATFSFDDMEHFAAVGKSKVSGGYLYSRWANPTVDALARTIAALEGAEAAACYASGMGAIAAVLTSILGRGDHLVAARQLYGGTFGFINRSLLRDGVDTEFVDITDHAAVRAAIRRETKALYCETIGNPMLPVADLASLATIAHEHGFPLIVDATFTPPCLLQPLAYGVDLSIHAATKYLAGHGDVLAGVVSGTQEAIERIRLDNVETGAVLAPWEAWLTLRGVQTLALRLERICRNAESLASMFEEHAGVDRVFYPGLGSHPQHVIAQSLLKRGAGGMMAIELSGGIEAGRRFMERLRIARAAASLGSTHTLVVHPASVTHTQLTRAQREVTGISDGLVRISVGIEDAADLLLDFDQALA